MRIQVVDKDEGLMAVMAETLRGIRGEGQVVVQLSSSPARAAAALRSPEADLLIVEAHLLENASPRPAGSPGPAVILLSALAENDPVVVRAKAVAGETRFLAKPVSLARLAEYAALVAREGHERRSFARGDDPSTVDAVSDILPAEADAFRNVTTLTRVWAQKGSGIARLTAEDFEGQEPFAGGGPVTDRGMELVAHALRAGHLEIEERTVRGEGRWSELGTALFRRVYRPDRTDFAFENRYRVLAPTRWTSHVGALPIEPPARRVVHAADGRERLGDLLACLGVSPEAVSPDLHCLRRLRVIALAGGASSVSTRNRSASAPSEEEHGARPSSEARSARRQVAERMRDAMGRTSEADAHRARLTKERERLRDAPPAVVLCIPAAAPPHLVSEAEHRMRTRYRALADDLRLPRDVRDLAADLAQIVERAGLLLGRLATQGPGTPLPPPAPRVGPPDRSLSSARADSRSDTSTDIRTAGDDPERLLDHGRRLIERGDWARADRVLSRARDIQLAHAGVLANLAWARIHNPNLPEATRREDARDLLLLAEQFDRDDVDGQYYLACLLHETGDHDGAARRVDRALAMDPAHVLAARLARQIARARKD